MVVSVRGEIDEAFHTVVHEITHILGMSSALFPYFRDAGGAPRTVRCPQEFAGDTHDETGDDELRACTCVWFRGVVCSRVASLRDSGVQLSKLRVRVNS